MSPQNGDDTRLPPKHSTVLLMLTIADTTWRMFVPIVGLMFAGLWLDQQVATKPWLMILGIIAGTTIAIVLVRLQIKRVKKT